MPPCPAILYAHRLPSRAAQMIVIPIARGSSLDSLRVRPADIVVDRKRRGEIRERDGGMGKGSRKDQAVLERLAHPGTLMGQHRVRLSTGS